MSVELLELPHPNFDGPSVGFISLLGPVMKDNHNPQFAVWLAAYGKRLIEVAAKCGASSPQEIAPTQSLSQDVPQPPIQPKPK